MRVEHRPMKLPLFRLRFDVLREIPSGQPNSARPRQASQRAKLFVVPHARDYVISISFPVPIGSRFEVIAKLLFALQERPIEGRVIQIVRGLGGEELQERCRPGAKALRVKELFSE